MKLFKRILDPDGPAAVAAGDERRSRQRFAINPKFPLRATLSFIGRDENGELLGSSKAGWDWKGRLINFSELGARLQLAPGVRVPVGEACDLRLSLENYQIVLPCHTTNIREQADGMVVGLKLEMMDESTATAYHQLLNTVALGVTLKLEFKRTKTDDSGYLTERYSSPHASHLTIWRYHPERNIAAFQLVLQDCLVRAAGEQGIEYLAGSHANDAQRTSGVRLWEIQRLFQWVVPNLAPEVPPDVQTFLKGYAA